MQSAVPAGVGAMAAILGLDDEAVVEICANYSGDGIVEAVNFTLTNNAMARSQAI
jgi:[acyl-carrier-protein] S-malonyltransferase